MKTTSQVDSYRHVSSHIRSFKYMGLWFYIPHPLSSIKFWMSILSRLFFGILVFVLPTSLQFVYLIKLIMTGNAEIQEVAGIVNLVLTELLTSIKLLDLRLRRARLMRLIDQLISARPYYSVPIHTVMRQRAVELSRRLYACFLISAFLDVSVHMVVVPALHGFETLPLKMDLILFDVNAEPYFKYICAFQILYKPMMIITFMTLQTMPWAAMIYAIGELDVLIHKIENMKDAIEVVKSEKNCDENEAFSEIFTECVKQHRDITRFVASIQSAFGGQLSLFLILNACIIGMTGVQILSIESPTKNISVVIWVLMYISIFILMLFIDCYFGNTITIKSLHVATVAYASPWLKLSTKSKRNLIIFIAQTQQPLVIMTIKLVPVSLDTFTKVMNWTYKGFAVLNQMK